MTDIESSCTFISNQYDKQTEEIKETKQKMEELTKTCQNLDKSMKHFETKYEKSNEEIMDLKFRSMCENLIFCAIQEGTSDTEDCEKLAKNFIETHLELTTTEMTFDRAYRLPIHKKSNKTGPIVVKFHNYNDREKVRIKSSENHIRGKLRGLTLGVRIQQPLEYRDARRAFKPIMDREIQRGNHVRIVGNKLFVNNVCTCKFTDDKMTRCARYRLETRTVTRSTYQ